MAADKFDVIFGETGEVHSIDSAVFAIDFSVKKVVENGIIFSVVFVAVIAGDIVFLDAVLADLDLASSKQFSLFAAEFAGSKIIIHFVAPFYHDIINGKTNIKNTYSAKARITTSIE